MSVIRTSLVVAIASAMCLLSGVLVGAAPEQTPLDRAKDLYRTAAYDDALGVLNSIPADTPSANPVEVNEYRVFCLLALDRKDEARAAITALVTADPFYQLSDEDASPRVQAIFKEVRQSVLPDIVQHAYMDAKAAYDRKDPQATAAFDKVLTLLKDPDLSSNRELADLTVVVGAFRDLSKAREAAAVPAASSPARSAVPPASTAAPVAPTDSKVYREGEANLVAPVAITQTMPTALLPGQRLWAGAVELLIDENGNVQSARMATPIYGPYDKLLLQAASSWKYQPATKDGMPVRYVKVIAVRIDTRPPCAQAVTNLCRPANE